LIDLPRSFGWAEE